MYYLPVSLAVVIFYTYPIITMAGEKILDRKKPKLIEIGCFILAFLGLTLALKIDAQAINPTGFALAITASLGMSVSYLISDRKLKDIPSAQLTFHMAITGLIIMSMILLITRSFNPGELHFSNLASVFLASFSFAVAFFLMFKGIGIIGAVNTAMILNLEPIFTIGLALILLNERLSGVQLMGATLVLLAITMIQRYQASISRNK